MKLFLSIMLFAICLFSMPGTSSGSGSPPSQVSFVQGQPVDFTAMVINQVANYEFTAFVSNQTFEMAVLPKEGGFVVVQDSNLELQATYKNDKNATFNTTENTMLDNDDIRTYSLTDKVPRKTITQNIESRSRSTIRADSQI